MQLETRSFTAELRAIEDGENRVIEGTAIVYNQLSEDLGGYREQIAPGAFSESMAGDVKAFWNHNYDLILGRTLAGTLILEDSADGVRFKNILPPTEQGRAYHTAVKRGDVNGVSFGFSVREGVVEWDFEAEPAIRTIRKGKIFEVSPGVSFPAYPQTDSEARSLVRREFEAARSNVKKGTPIVVLQRKLDALSLFR